MTTPGFPVWAWKLPVPIDGRLTKASDALHTLYGEVYMMQWRGCLVFYTGGDICYCRRCTAYLECLVTGCLAIVGEELELGGVMILCEECGNKRCPHASDHTYECTRSNEPGQPGSIYGLVTEV